jgi:virulence-associated protein VagC
VVNDRISAVKVSLVILPLQKPASDAKATDTFTETHPLAPQRSNA